MAKDFGRKNIWWITLSMAFSRFHEVCHRLQTYPINRLLQLTSPSDILYVVPLHDGGKKINSVRLPPPSRTERMTESIIVCNIYEIALH